MIVGLDHVQIAAPPGGEPQARSFYGDALGLTELPKPPVLATRGGLWFAVGTIQQLHIGIEQQLLPPAGRIPPSRSTRRRRWRRSPENSRGSATSPAGTPTCRERDASTS